LSSDKKILFFTLNLKENLESEILQISNQNITTIFTKGATKKKYFVDYPIEVEISFYFTVLD